MMVELVVARLGLDSATDSYVIVLRERDGDRTLPIWIGKPEAESIVMQMNQVKRERPITHDLCRSLIVALGGRLRRVVITRVEKSTYHAEMQLDGPTGVVELDARPSDSIAIALRLQAPIFAPAALLSAAEHGDDADDANEAVGERTAEQLKSYLEHLRPEDFGKFSP